MGRAVATLVGAYRGAGGPAVLVTGEVGAFAMRAAIWLNYLAVSLEGSMREDGDVQHRAFAEQAVEGLLRDPLRVAFLEQAAAAVPPA